VNGKRVSQVLAVAAPHLSEGERVELATFAKVGSVSVKRKVTTTAAVAALAGGLVIVSVSARSMYIAMTGRRLLFFDGHAGSGRPGQKLLMSVPRGAGAGSGDQEGAADPDSGARRRGPGKGATAHVPRPCREDGGRVISALHE
jgi:hypothetical protein